MAKFPIVKNRLYPPELFSHKLLMAIALERPLQLYRLLKILLELDPLLNYCSYCRELCEEEEKMLRNFSKLHNLLRDLTDNLQIRSIAEMYLKGCALLSKLSCLPDVLGPSDSYNMVHLILALISKSFGLRIPEFEAESSELESRFPFLKLRVAMEIESLSSELRDEVLADRHHQEGHYNTGDRI